MNAAAVASAASADPTAAKAAKAGAQFEAILLNMVFGDLQRAFTQLPGAQQDAISRSYDSFGMEALTSGLARGGGIGLGPFIARALMKHATKNSEGT